jgi:hypothetical protein
MAASVDFYSVLSPAGHRSAHASPTGARLNSLEGKTICEVWDHHFRGDDMFTILRAALHAKYQRLQFVDWNKFGQLEYVAKDILQDAFRLNGCDAVIAGVGA